MGTKLRNLYFPLFVALFLFGCSQGKDGALNPSSTLDAIYPPAIDSEDAENTDEDTEIEEDTYSIWTDPCVECQMYFCPPLDSVWQKQICINKCDDPPTVVYEGECIEYLPVSYTHLTLPTSDLV